LDAAEEVSEADLDTLQSLVDKSLLRRRDERYWMLETIREYAAERLEDSGEAETIRDRHLDRFLALGERAYDERLSSASAWLPILAAEQDNCRAALEWAAARRPQAELCLASATAFYWNLRGHGLEASDQLVQALARYPTRDTVRARALMHLGDILVSRHIDRREEAMSYLDEALRLWRDERDVLGEALALERIGVAHHAAGDDRAARRALEQSLTLRRQAGAPELLEARSLGGLCELLVAAGEIEAAERRAQELYELAGHYEDRETQHGALHHLADCPLIGGDYEKAERRYARALAHARDYGFLRSCPTELLGVAMSVAGQEDHARAVRLAGAAYAQREAFGITGPSPVLFWNRLQEWFIGGARASLTPEEAERAERAGREAPFDEVVDEVLGERAEDGRAA